MGLKEKIIENTTPLPIQVKLRRLRIYGKDTFFGTAEPIYIGDSDNIRDFLQPEITKEIVDGEFGSLHFIPEFVGKDYLGFVDYSGIEIKNNQKYNFEVTSIREQKIGNIDWIFTAKTLSEAPNVDRVMYTVGPHQPEKAKPK